ncbi:hypothetical protein NGRA_3230 [Nosema granulosis]|uniref:Uncharacterized protein n=1 Tax=Nosema granulosis TaxID=83296 RepID=A0A9P6GWL7_9MICR|nr:hypothetical protein NGRA_3230 [Nosema granulosis]
MTSEKLNQVHGQLKPLFSDELQFREHGLEQINGHYDSEDQQPDETDDDVVKNNHPKKTAKNTFIGIKNPFSGVSLETVKEHDLILMESLSDRSKGEWTEAYYIGLWRRKNSIIK